MSPAQSTAFARSTCLSFGSENFGVSKYFGSGQKRSVVPVCFLPTVPTTLRLLERSPFLKFMR